MLTDLTKRLQWSNLLNKPASSVAEIDDAVSKRHTRNKDIYLNQGGANQVSASELRGHVDNNAIHREMNYDADYKAYVIDN